MSIKQYTGAIFDMDGLLFDTERVYQQTWEEIAAERGVVLGDRYHEAISGTNGDVMCRVIERFYHVEDGMEIMLDCRRRIREKLSREAPLKAGALEIVRFFHARHFRLAVASSSSREQIASNLAHSGLAPYFDVIVSGDDVRVGKPDPEVFLCAAKAIGCRPEQCFVFEDSVSGVKAGHAAGCDVIMVPDLFQPNPEIRPLCFRVADSLEAAIPELQSVMDGNAGRE